MPDHSAPAFLDRHLSFLTERDLGALVTIKADGRPQLSNINYACDLPTRTVRVSTTAGRAKVHNLRRDPRASLYVSASDGGAYVVYEGTVTLSEVAADPHDATVTELVALYRAVQGEHPDWDEYRAVMVKDERLVVRLELERAYGWTGA